MGLMQQAYETYEYAEKKLAGVYIAGKAPLAPVGHSITKAKIEITLYADGSFVRADPVNEDEAATVFPVTEESAGRSGTGAGKMPHPLCDYLSYLCPLDEIKYQSYCEQLHCWMESPFTHPFLSAIWVYLENGTILRDLTSAGLIQLEGGQLDEKAQKSFVRWRVIDVGNEEPACWKNRNLQNSYINFYHSRIAERESVSCAITGEQATAASQHAKGVVSLYGNAKLISANDDTGFTYRGRFTDDSEVVGISYEASQKAHNALRWVISNQGNIFGGRDFVCWCPQGKTLPSLRHGLFSGRASKEPKYTPSDYRDELNKILRGMQSEFSPESTAVTAVFDAATTGRLSLNYYSELPVNDFLERLAYWEESCCWPNGDFGIQSPSLYKIINFAYGTLREEKNGIRLDVDDNLTKQLFLRLLTCRVEKALFPADIERSLVEKAGHLELYPDDEKSKYLRRNLLFTACAVIKKYRFDNIKEEWSMALEPEKKNISYQYGRLLAVLEKIEWDTYDKDEKRETNAIRLQSMYTQRPLHTFRIVMEQLQKAYYPRLSAGSRIFYERLISQIMEQISLCPEAEQDKPLADVYLLGYYLQKNELYLKSKTNNNNNTENTEE